MKKNIGSIILLIVVIGLGIYFWPKGDQSNMTEQKEITKGLQVTILKEGTGAAAKNGDTVSVNYTGTFEDGKKFDSNIDPVFNHVQPFEFALGARQVIAGWDQGVLGMKVGEKRKLVIAPELGYGASGAGTIPPNSTLVFEVELLAIK